MSKQKRLLWQIGLIIIYIIIAALGFAIAYFIKITFLKPSSQTITHVQPVPTPIGWKTYNNTTYQIQFSYPPTDTIKTSSYGFGVGSLVLQNTQGGTDFQILFLPKSLADMVGQDFDSYYVMPNNTTKTIKNPLSKDNMTEEFTKISNSTVDGLRAVDYRSLASNAKPSTKSEIGTFVETGNNLVLISTGEENKNKLQEVLNSFQYQ